MEPLQIVWEIHTDLPREGPGGLTYTRQALALLPPLPQPQILDIGCGPGAQTLELAELTDGHITAVDTHQPYLDCLQQAAQASGCADRIRCVNQSMDALSFPDRAFDLLWAAGAIYLIGLETGLRQWHRLLKPGGHLVFSELVWTRSHPPEPVQTFWRAGYPDMRSLAAVLQLIPTCGYTLLGHFLLPEDAWWNYYKPLEARLAQLRDRYRCEPSALAVLDQEQQEIELYRQYHNWYGYSFFALQAQA